MKIEVLQPTESKTWLNKYKKYTIQYPNGYPVTIRKIYSCEDCEISIGGYFGNKVYRYKNTKKCEACGNKNDELSQLCLAQTGQTPREYQLSKGVAWNE